MDKNGFLDALTAYSRNPGPEIPAILEQYLNGIAANGETLYHWPLLKPLLFAKMEQVIEELQKGLGSEVIPERPNVENVPFDVMHARIVEAFHKFNGTPFTIQRLCELLIDPKRHYKRSDKFLRGLEKNVLVVSTVDPFGRNVVSEVGNKHLVNGLDTVGSPFFPRDSSITSNLPPVPGWVTSAPSVTSPHSGAPTAVADQKQSQPSSQDSAVTTSVVSGVVTSPYGEPPQASQTEEVVEETVVTMDTSESSVADGRETGSEDGMGREDSNTSSSSSSSSEELSANDTSDNSPDVPATAADTDTSHTSPWVSVLAEGENKVHVPLSDAADVDDRALGVTEVDSSDESNRSASETSPPQAVGVGGTDSVLSSSGVNSSSTSESESSEKSSSCVDDSISLESESSEKSSSRVDDSSSLESESSEKSSFRVDDSSSLERESREKSSFRVDDSSLLESESSEKSSSRVDDSSSLERESSEKSSSGVDSSSSELSMDTSCVQDSYNDSTGFDTAFVSEEMSALEHSGVCSGSEGLSGVSSEAPSMDTCPPLQDAVSPVLQSSQAVDSDCHSEVADSLDVCFQGVTTPAFRDEHTTTDNIEKPDCSLDSTPTSPPTQPVDLSSALHSTASRNTRMNPSSPDSPSDSQEPQAKRRRLSHEPSHVHVSSKTSTDVSVSSDFPVSSHTLGDVAASSDIPVSSSISGDVTVPSAFPVSSSTSGDVTAPSAFPVSSSTSADVTVSSDFPASSSTSGDVAMSLDSDPVSTTESNMTSDLNSPADPLCVQEANIHGGFVDSELGVHPEVHEHGSEGRECVASPPSLEASSSDSQGFDATVESQNIVDTEATSVEGSAKLEGFDQAEELKKTEEPEKEEEISEGNIVNPQN